MIALFFPFISNPAFQLVFKILFYTSFVWLPLLLIIFTLDMWATYLRAKNIAAQKTVLLEIKLPKEIFKSPAAMELFINILNQGGGGAKFMDKYWKGSIAAWFSLELVSIDGAIHFFIWTRTSYRNLIETTLYSQFPGIEIYEVPDYTLPVTFNSETTGLWATEFDLTKPDPYPIKTYVDYKMDQDPKEEYKVDPMTPLIEFLGSLGKGHQAWIQIILKAHKAEDKDPATGKMVDLKWQKAAGDEITKILDKTKPEKDAEGKEKKPGRGLTEGERDVIAALERSISKNGFDVGIRALYIAPKDIFNQGNAGGIIAGMTHYNSNALNGFKPARSPGVAYAWLTDRKGNRLNGQKQRMLDAYKRRAYFYNEWKRPYFVLNSEELATIYHFPGGVAATPTFSRISSKKSEAPANLPQ